MEDPAPESDAPTQTFTSEDGVPNVHARVLGDATSINAGFYSRTHPDWFRAHGEVETMVKTDRSGNPIKRTRLVIKNANVDIIGPEFWKNHQYVLREEKCRYENVKKFDINHRLPPFNWTVVRINICNFEHQMMGQL